MDVHNLVDGIQLRNLHILQYIMDAIKTNSAMATFHIYLPL